VAVLLSQRSNPVVEDNYHILAVFVEFLHRNFRTLSVVCCVDKWRESAVNRGLVEWVIFMLLFIASMSVVVFFIGVVVVIFLIRIVVVVAMVVVIVVVMVVVIVAVTATVALGSMARFYTFCVL